MLAHDDNRLYTPQQAALQDYYGRPLTWGHVVEAHAWLSLHSSCPDRGYDGTSTITFSTASGFDSDGETCPCQNDLDRRSAYEYACRKCPGPICGHCWARTCKCGFRFSAATLSQELQEWHLPRWRVGRHSDRLRCPECPADEANWDLDVRSDSEEGEDPLPPGPGA